MMINLMNLISNTWLIIILLMIVKLGNDSFFPT